MAENRRQHRVWDFGPFHLDESERLLLRDQQPVAMTPKVFDTLIVLVERNGHLVEKDELMRRLWPDTFVDEGALTRNISDLRKALGREGFIETIPKRGYRFVAPVRQMFADSDALVVERTTEARLVIEEREENGSESNPAQTFQAPRELRTSNLFANKKLLALSAVAVVVLLGVTFFSVRRLLRRAETSSFQTMTVAQFTNSGNVVTAAISPDGKYVATALEEKGLQSLWLRQTASTASSIQLTQPAAIEFWGLTFSGDSNFLYYLTWERHQSEEELYRIPAFGGAAEKIPTFSADTPITLSPDGQRFAYTTAILTTTGEGYLKVARTDGSERQVFLKRSKPDFFAVFPGGAAWSPDGKKIAYAAGGLTDRSARFMSVYLFDVATQTETRLSSRTWNDIGRVAWLGDGSGVIFVANEKTDDPHQVWFLSYPSGETRRITNDLHDYQSVSATADGATVSAVQTQVETAISVVPSGNDSQPKDIFREVGSARENFSWTPDGRIVYASHAGGSWDIFIMDADGGGRKQLTRGPHDDIFPTVSADGKDIFFVSNRSGNSNIWRLKLEGGDPVQFTHGINETFPECSPDGKWVVFQRGYGAETTTVWKVSTAGGEPQPLPDRFAQRPTFSPDGKLLAYVSHDGEIWRVKIILFETGELVRSFSFSQNITSRNFRWTPDGRSLAYVRNDDGTSNLWLQPLDGGPPRRLTNFNVGQITFFAWSRDGKTLAAAHTAKVSDVVLLRNFR